MSEQRGYYGIGVEGGAKPMNFGNLARTAHGFGASFVFTVASEKYIKQPKSDTTKSDNHMPWYEYKNIKEFNLPQKCQLVGVELIEDAENLPEFRHPMKAAYVLGPEGGELSKEMIELCNFVVKIPTRFCLNVATAGAIIMYDRMIATRKFGARPIHIGAKSEMPEIHKHGKPTYQGNQRK